jgi:ABC-type uncharacterized transport system substrate-binding protein
LYRALHTSGDRVAALSYNRYAEYDLCNADGRNVRMDLRWAGTDIKRMRSLAQELVGLQPDIIVTTSTVATAALQWETPTIPSPAASSSGLN